MKLIDPLCSRKENVMGNKKKDLGRAYQVRREHWAVYCSGTQSFILTFSHSFVSQFWDLY